MTSGNTTQLPAEIVRLLDAAAKRVKNIYVLRGVVVVGAVFVLTALAAMIADACLVLFNTWSRYALSAAVWLPTLALLAWLVVRPAMRPISRRRAAKALDDRHPEFEERVTTLVELAERADTDKAYIGSEQIYNRLVQETIACTNKVDVNAEFTSRTVKRRLKWLGIALGLLLGSFAIFPNFAGILFVRVTLPWLDLGSVFANWIEVTPGSVVMLKGSTIEIKAKRLKPQLKDDMMLRISRHNGKGWGEEFAEVLPEEGYREITDMSQALWRYRVSCGPAVSRYYTVRVCELPRYKSFVARLDYPAYTGQAPLAFTNEQVGTIQAIEGTKVAFDLVLEGAGTTAELELAGKNGKRVSDDGHLAATMVSNNVSTWSMQMVSAEGFRSPKKSGPFVSVIDQSPTIVIESPNKTLQLPPHAKLPIVYTANDDVGIAEIEVLRRIEDEPWHHENVDRFEPGKRLHRSVAEMDLSRYDLLNARDIKFLLVVRDAYPEELGGPHTVTSTPVVVAFRSDARTYEYQTLEERYRYANEAMREAERRLETAERLARNSENNVNREQNKTSENTEKQIADLAHEVDEAEKRAEEQAEILDDLEGLSTMAEELRDFAEKELAPVREKLEEAQFAAPEKRVEALNRMQPMLREARERMQEAEKELKGRVEQVQNYEKTRDLADRQEALAKAAERLTKPLEEGEEKPKNLGQKLDAWKQLEQAAARLAEELNRTMRSPDVEEAQRKMELAAEKMAEFKRDYENGEKNMKPEQRESLQLQQAAQQAKVREQAIDQAEQQSKRAEEFLAKALERAQAAAKEQNLDQRANRVREAQNFERTAEAAQKESLRNLERAESIKQVADDTRREKQAEALDHLQEAEKGAANRVDELKQALEAQKAVTQAMKGEDAKDAKTSSDASKPRDASKSSNSSDPKKALAELRKAESAAEDALDALKRHDAEATQKAQSAEKDATAAARQAHAANVLDQAERSAEKARKMAEDAKRNPKNDWHWNRAIEEQKEAVKDVRKAVDTMAEALGVSPAQIARERRNEKLDDRRRDAEAVAARAQAQVEDALKRNDKDAAKRFGKVAAIAADRAAGLAKVTETEAAEETGEEAGEEQAKTGEEAADTSSSSESSDSSQTSDSSKTSEPGEKTEPSPANPTSQTSPQLANEAAEALDTAAAEQARQLDIDPNASSAGASDEKSDEPSQGGGGKGSQRDQVQRELDKAENTIPAALRGKLSTKAWFRIRGAVREGMGERDLKNVPPEYRDLVRRYFLKLSQQEDAKK